MGKQIIFIYGASGSGVSTLGKYIAERTGLFRMDTDDYFWENTDPPYSVKRAAEVRVALMKRDIERSEGAVISGSLDGWGDALMPYFTLALRVMTDTDTRIARLKEREGKKLGKRIEKGGDMYEHHLAFLAWAADYDTADTSKRSKARHDEWEKRLSCPVLYLNGTDSPEDNFEKIKKYLSQG